MNRAQCPRMLPPAVSHRSLPYACPAGHPQPGSTYSHSAGIIGLGTDGTAMYMPHCEVFWPNAKGPYAG